MYSKGFYLFFKRIFDILFSFLGILMLFILLWWWVFIINLISTKGHPFFLQKRYGKNKKIFKIIKFRTMKLDASPYCAPSDMNENQQKNMETKLHLRILLCRFRQVQLLDFLVQTAVERQLFSSLPLVFLNRQKVKLSAVDISLELNQRRL